MTTKRVCPGCRTIQEMGAPSCVKCRVQFVTAAKVHVSFVNLCMRIGAVFSFAAVVIAVGARFVSAI